MKLDSVKDLVRKKLQGSFLLWERGSLTVCPSPKMWLHLAGVGMVQVWILLLFSAIAKIAVHLLGSFLHLFNIYLFNIYFFHRQVKWNLFLNKILLIAVVFLLSLKNTAWMIKCTKKPHNTFYGWAWHLHSLPYSRLVSLVHGQTKGDERDPW